MVTRLPVIVAAVCILFLSASPGFAQYAPQGSPDDEWTVTVYPLLAWIPTHVGIDINLPDGGDTGGGGNGGAGGSTGGELLNTSWDGAYLGGFSAARGGWRFDVDGLWAAVGGDRPERPQLSVDTDVIYGHGAVSRRVYKALFVSAGVRRMALKYEIRLASNEPFTRKPGVWDPVVGVGFHHVRDAFELHAGAEGGGFGVGSDWEAAAVVRADWKPFRHFGLTAGYNFLQFEVSDDVRERTLVARQTLHGPVVGFGLYF